MIYDIARRGSQTEFDSVEIVKHVAIVTVWRHEILFDHLRLIRHTPSCLLETEVNDFLSCCGLTWHLFVLWANPRGELLTFWGMN
jgi:hypothetical protein